MSVTLNAEEAEYLRDLARQCRNTNDPNDVRRLANLIEYRMANIDRAKRGQYVIYKPTDQRAKVLEEEDGTLKLKFKDGRVKYACQNQVISIA